MEAHPEVSSSREVLPIFMEGHSHDPVCSVEGFLHSVPMVDVDIDVQHPLVVPGREAGRAEISTLDFQERPTSRGSETLLLL